MGSSNSLHLTSAAFLGLTSMVLLSTKDVLNLQKQYVSYAIFHQNDVNKLSHLFCVWPILWTFFCMFHHSRPVVPALPFTNHALFVSGMYMAYYPMLDASTLGGSALKQLVTGMVFSCWVTSGLAAKFFPGKSAKVSAVINVLCWIAQFYTHGKHEGRAPALLKNPAQAFLAAPIFVALEALADLGIGDFKAKMAAIQPEVDQSVKLLDAGRYSAVSQLEIKPMTAGGCALFTLALYLLPMLSAKGGKLKSK